MDAETKGINKRSAEKNESEDENISDKKRIKFLQNSNSNYQKKSIFQFGNYDRYYGYRNQNNDTDHRVQAFLEKKDLFLDKTILDIGCNKGVITIQVAELLNPKSILGIDIDSKLIKFARKNLLKSSNKATIEKTSFRQANYVLKQEHLLNIEKPQYDVILCLSVTKWIHLNFGDDGLKFALRRMYKQLNSGGCLILEPQPWKSYHRRKNLTSEIFYNYKNIKFFPINFKEFLLSESVGFRICYKLSTPQHSSKGFQRELDVYEK